MKFRCTICNEITVFRIFIDEQGKKSKYATCAKCGGRCLTDTLKAMEPDTIINEDILVVLKNIEKILTRMEVIFNGFIGNIPEDDSTKEGDRLSKNEPFKTARKKGRATKEDERGVRSEVDEGGRGLVVKEIDRELET
jgi:hypothetical protein